MEKITREHGDLFFNPEVLPEFGVVYHYDTWSHAISLWQPLLELMEDAYPDIPLYMIDLQSPQYLKFKESSAFDSQGDAEALFVRGGEILQILILGSLKKAQTQVLRAGLDMLERCRNPEEFQLQRVIFFIETQVGSFPIVPSTKIADDLGCVGDDAEELLIAYGKKFNVDVSEFQFSEYFIGEGFDPIGGLIHFVKYLTNGFRTSTPPLKTLTIGHLIKGIQAGRLNEAVIWGDGAEKSSVPAPIPPNV